MATENSGSTSAHAEICDSIIALARLQNQFRDALRTNMEANQMDWTVLGKKLSVSGHRIKQFLHRERPCAKGEWLNTLAEHIGQQELAGRIQEIASDESMHEKYLALSIFAERVIRLVFDLQRAYDPYSQDMSIASFSQVFGEKAMAIEGVMKFFKDSTSALSQDDLFLTEVERILSDKTVLESRVAQVQEERQAKIQEKLSRWKDLCEKNPELDASYATLGKMLGLGSTTVRNALIGDPKYLATLDSLLEQANEYIAQKEQHSTKKKRGQGKQLGSARTCSPRTTKDTAQVEDAPVEPKGAIASICGEVRKTGQCPFDALLSREKALDPMVALFERLRRGGDDPFELTESNFRDIKLGVNEAFVRAIIDLIRPLRALLGVLAQTDSPDQKLALYRSLEEELQQLQLSINLAAQKHARSMLPMIEGQRQFWRELRKGQ